jgi:molybdopterin converting factor small subunit
MDIQTKLMGILKEQMPESGRLHVPDGATINDVLLALEIPVDSVHVFMVNQRLILDHAHVLKPGDELAVIPPAVGG